jgi:hypothetical protein
MQNSKGIAGLANRKQSANFGSLWIVMKKKKILAKASYQV